MAVRCRLFTPELQWQLKGTWRILQGWVPTGNAWASCWKFAPLFIHDGQVPRFSEGPDMEAVLASRSVAAEGQVAHEAGASFELSVSARGMGLWELRPC